MKKGIAFLLITVLLIDLTSCSSYRLLSTEQDFETYESLDHIQILDIQSRQDGIIVFNEKFPGKMEYNEVHGLQQMHFPYSISNSIIFNMQEAKAEFIMNNGIRYRIISQDKSGFLCISTDTIRTPFSDIEQMNVKEKDPLKTTLLIMGLSAVFIGITGYLIGSNFTIYTQGM
jgi:hypothetical protein